MDITHKVKLDHKEINEAIVLYLTTKGLDIDGKELDINITAGRKSGNYCDIDIISGRVTTEEFPEPVNSYKYTVATVTEEDEDEEEAILNAVSIPSDEVAHSRPIFGH
tara:strand:+ start:615 stop:938 length:324 start_codon:yes stop_codon:yes gene_type:complete